MISNAKAQMFLHFWMYHISSNTLSQLYYLNHVAEHLSSHPVLQDILLFPLFPGFTALSSRAVNQNLKRFSGFPGPAGTRLSMWYMCALEPLQWKIHESGLMACKRNTLASYKYYILPQALQCRVQCLFTSNKSTHRRLCFPCSQDSR